MSYVVKKKPRKPRSVQPSPAAEPLPVAPTGHGYMIGSKVSHPMFGDGVVTDIDADTLTIKFKGNLMKLIVASFVKPQH